MHGHGEAPHSGSLSTPGGAIHWLCQSGAAPASPDALSPEERTAFDALKSDKRRRDWLLGRLTAKRLLRRVLADLGRDLPPDGIVVLRHADGWPQVSLPALGDAAPALTLSISHAGEWAFCAAMLGQNQALGCDIEAIEPRSDGFIEDYFTAAERELVAQAESLRYVYANAIWSSKEAALKAIRRGLAEDTRIVTCLPQGTDLTDGRVAATRPSVRSLANDWQPLLIHWERPERALPALAGWWRELDGFVLTIAVAGRPNG